VDTDRLSLLRRARDLLADALATESECSACGAHIEVKSADLPQVSRELRAVLAEIDKIPGSGEVSDLDLLADGIVTDLDERRRRRTAG
jgi:hypothetical protein